jgi:hypothetical protein
MEEYARNSMSPERFKQFQRDNKSFEKRLAQIRRQKRFTQMRLYAKQMPKATPVKDKRDLYDRANSPTAFEKSKIKRLPA